MKVNLHASRTLLLILDESSQVDAAFVVACTGFAQDNQILLHLKRIAPAWHAAKSLAL